MRIYHHLRFLPGEEAELERRLDDAVPVPVGAGVNHAHVLVDEPLRVGLGRAEVDQAQPPRVGVVQEVAPVRVRLHVPPLEEFLQGHVQHEPAEQVPVRLGEFADPVQGDAGHEVRAQDAATAQGAVDVRHVQVRAAGDQGLEPPLARCFVPVVALEGELLLGDVDRVLDVQTLGEYARGLDEAHEVVDVRRYAIGHAGVLHLEHDLLAAVLEPSLVHLTDGRRRHGRPLEIFQVVFPIVSELCHQNLLELLPRHRVCTVPHALQGFLDLRRDEILVLNAEHLAELQCSTSHSTERYSKALRIARSQK
mmetsp:Transcript_10584/g.26827  ORF Transcript_10584/g.26827 Transcript_10584/m.26827 type:complete len:308 (+) Transcript_10584:461-1384(+)